MRILESLDHPFVFIIALAVGIVAAQKIIAYGAGKAGLPELNKWILNQQ
jgi:hypothetical protein